jgi:hypothetical protein
MRTITAYTTATDVVLRDAADLGGVQMPSKYHPAEPEYGQEGQQEADHADEQARLPVPAQSHRVHLGSDRERQDRRTRAGQENHDVCLGLVHACVHGLRDTANAAQPVSGRAASGLAGASGDGVDAVGGAGRVDFAGGSGLSGCGAVGRTPHVHVNRH